MSSNTLDYIYPIIVPSDSDVEDVFSSATTPNYTPALPDYSPASPGNTSPDPSCDNRDLAGELLIWSRPTKVEVSKELSKVSMVNTSLKKLKHHLAGFDMVVKERTTATAITEGSWGVSKLIANNMSIEKQTYKHFMSRFKQHEKVLVITALKDDLRKLKGKALVDNAITKHTIDQEMLKIDKIRSANTSSTLKNKVEAHPRKVKSSLKNKNSVVEPKGTATVQHSKLNANSELKYVKCNGCMLSDNHDLCVLDFINNVNARVKSKSVKKSSKRKVWKPTRKVFTNIRYIWRPTGRNFTIVGNACHLTRITTTNDVPLRKPTALENETPKPVITLAVQMVLWYLDSGCSKHMIGDRSQLTNFVNKFLGTVKFRNDHMAKIMGYGDYQIGNSNLEVAFRQHTCFIRNLEGVDLLTRSRGNNLYTLSLRDMMASSPICLLSKASKTKSWLWHRCLSHLNFGTINHLARYGLIRVLPKLKFEKDHLCSSYAMGKSKKKQHKPKSEDTNQEKLYLLTWIFVDQCVSHALMITLDSHGLNFDELTAMASEHSSSGPALHEMTPATNTSEVVAPIHEVVALILDVSTGSPSSTNVDQDAPSPSHSQTTPKTQPPVIPNDVEASSPPSYLQSKSKGFSKLKGTEDNSSGPYHDGRVKSVISRAFIG
ncbi:retrovirus-related pol polyprotein from transposon TNT 1-94 [Tanacetum coccineum]